MIDAVLTWYALSTLGWMLAALLKYHRRDLRAYLWCLIWPVGLVIHW